MFRAWNHPMNPLCLLSPFTLRRLLAVLVFVLSSVFMLADKADATRVSGRQAVAFLNQQRVANGLPTVGFSPELSEGCAAHNNYMRQNGFGHRENPSKPGYTAEGAGEGPYGGGSEVLSYGGYDSSEKNPWESAPIHLYLMLEPQVILAGYDDGAYVCARMRSDYSQGDAPRFFSYPGPGTNNVRFRERAYESPYIPQELVGLPSGKVTGPNILLFSDGAGRDLRAERFSVTGPSGPVETKLVVESTSSQVGSGHWFAGGGVLIPVDPLKPEAKYRVAVDWVNSQGEQFAQSFSFTTRKKALDDSEGDGRGDVFRSKLKLSAAGGSKKFKRFRLKYSRNISGRSTKVVVRSTQKRCDSTGYCLDGRRRVLRRFRVKLKGIRRIWVRRPTRRLTETTVSVSVKGRKMRRGYIRGSSASRILLGPGLHWR